MDWFWNTIIHKKDIISPKITLQCMEGVLISILYSNCTKIRLYTQRERKTMNFIQIFMWYVARIIIQKYTLPLRKS